MDTEIFYAYFLFTYMFAFAGVLIILGSAMYRARLPTVTYLRLDGSVPAGSRHSIVNKYTLTAVTFFLNLLCLSLVLVFTILLR